MTTLAGKGGPAAHFEGLYEQIVEESRLLSQQMPCWPSNSGEPPQFDLEFLLSQGAEAGLDKLSGLLCDRLRRKIEVAQKLYRTYEPDLSRSTSAAALSANAMNQLCALMLLSSLRQKDARFLNSALKLIDGVTEPANVQVSDRLISLTNATLHLLLPLEHRPS